MSEKGRITQLLHEAGNGDRDAYNRLFPLVYERLRHIAQNQLARQPAPMRKTELLHELYLKLIDQTQADWRDRAHFFAVAARAMRHILVDHHRKRRALKRGGPQEPLPLDEERIAFEERSDQLLTLHELMDRLAELDERMHAVVDLRFFGGMTIPEIADLLHVSTSTVDRDWKKARGWLYQHMVDG